MTKNENVVGDHDVKDRTVSVRLRTDEDKGAMDLEAFRDFIVDNVQNHSMELFPMPAAGD